MAREEIHPRRTTDPNTVIWVGVRLGQIGRVVAAPGEFGEWLAAGRISSARSELENLWITLPDADWESIGPKIRQLIIELPESLDGVEIVDDPRLLVDVTEDVLHSSLGDYIASHGGQIDFLRLEGTDVHLDMSGACSHCAAATITLHGRIEGELRRRMGDEIRVRTDAEHESLWQRFKSRRSC